MVPTLEAIRKALREGGLAVVSEAESAEDRPVGEAWISQRRNWTEVASESATRSDVLWTLSVQFNPMQLRMDVQLVGIDSETGGNVARAHGARGRMGASVVGLKEALIRWRTSSVPWRHKKAMWVLACLKDEMSKPPNQPWSPPDQCRDAMLDILAWVSEVYNEERVP